MTVCELLPSYEPLAPVSRLPTRRQRHAIKQEGTNGESNCGNYCKQGCGRCIACSHYYTQAQVALDRCASLEWSQWWPAALKSPSVYFAYRAKQLAYLQANNYCGLASWRSPEESVDQAPSQLRAQRQLAPLPVLLPASFTNLAAADMTLEPQGDELLIKLPRSSTALAAAAAAGPAAADTAQQQGPAAHAGGAAGRRLSCLGLHKAYSTQPPQTKRTEQQEDHQQQQQGQELEVGRDCDIGKCWTPVPGLTNMQQGTRLGSRPVITQLHWLAHHTSRHCRNATVPAADALSLSPAASVASCYMEESEGEGDSRREGCQDELLFSMLLCTPRPSPVSCNAVGLNLAVDAGGSKGCRRRRFLDLESWGNRLVAGIKRKVPQRTQRAQHLAAGAPASEPVAITVDAAAAWPFLTESMQEV